MIRLAIDVGSGVTKIYMLGCGVVLSEATCIAVQTDSDDNGTVMVIKAYGDRARALSGKSALNTRIINPVVDGEIVNEKLLTPLLSYFLEKIEISHKKARSCEVMFVLPCGAGKKLKESYAAIAAECNIGRIFFTQTPYAAVLGHNVTLSETSPVFCLDIGHSVTNIAVFSLDGIISGLSVNLGGANIDVHIMDLLAENFSLKIGALTAERIKNTVGSMLEDDNKIIVADGRGISDGKPASVAVNSSDVEPTIRLYLDKICEYVNAVIKELPAEVASFVMHGGIYLSGGLAKMDGLAEYIGRQLGVAINECEEPALAAVIGAGTLLSSPVLCAKAATLD